MSKATYLDIFYIGGLTIRWANGLLDQIGSYIRIDGLTDRCLHRLKRLPCSVSCGAVISRVTEHDPASRRGKHGHVFGRRLFLLTLESLLEEIVLDLEYVQYFSTIS
jgi:hypothetical protein